MFGNTKFFNKIFYIQRYYCIFDELYFWRFWIIGYYIELKHKNKNTAWQSSEKNQ